MILNCEFMKDKQSVNKIRKMYVIGQQFEYKVYTFEGGPFNSLERF